MAKGRGDTVEKLFSPKRQYEIPIYQRRYVWGIENWDALWTDIKEKFDNRFNGEQSTSHFTGIIITRKNEKGQGLPKYQILDGQQRLTTFQIILCVIRDLCQSEKYTLRADSADLLIKNEGYNEKYKLYPKEGFDEKAFHDLVDSNSRGEHVMHRAYSHFMDAITNDIGTDFQNIDHLYDAITNDFHMVQIDLKKEDEPEKIFASLNATGRMLDEFDHLRNDLFLKAGEAGTDLYNTYWRHFDTESYWEKPQNLDQFLRHFLQATVNPECFQNQEGQEVKAFDVYLKQYRTKLDTDQTIKYEFQKLKKYSKVYQEMNDPDSKIGSRMRFYKEFEIDSLHPFILYVISEFSRFATSEGGSNNEVLLSDADLDLIFDILESYMMRRMLRWGREDHYKTVNRINDFFTEIHQNNRFNLTSFLNHLYQARRSPKLENQWSTDREVEVGLTERWHVEKGIRYILYRIEVEMRENEGISETIDFTEELQLHYIMPMKWENSWLLPGPDGPIQFGVLFSDEYKDNNRSWFFRPSQQGLVDESYLDVFTLALNRKNYYRSIGNLTLIDKDINVDQFAEKKPYFKGSELAITKTICDDYDSWDVSQINERTEKLINCFHKIWPSANCFIENRRKYLSEKYPQHSKVQGTVVKIFNNSLHVLLEEGIEGRIASGEITWGKRVDPSDFVNVGDVIEAMVLEISNNNPPIILSMKRLEPNPWELFEQKYAINTKITGHVLNITSHGAVVKINEHVNGFIHNFNLSWENPKATAERLLKIGQEVEASVLKVRPLEEYVSLGLKQLQQNRWEHLEQRIHIGTQITGCVTSISNSGMFVEIEKGIEGRINCPEISWWNNKSARLLFKEGDEIEVIVSQIDTSNQYVSLNFQQSPQNPWELLKQKYPIGTEVTGFIRKFFHRRNDQFVSVEIENGIDGLFYKPQLSLKKHDEVEVVIRKIDPTKQQVLLDFKQLKPNPWEHLEQRIDIGTQITGCVTSVSNSGMFVEIEKGIEGTVNCSELSWWNYHSASVLFKEGNKIEVIVLQINAFNRHVSLGFKQTPQDPWKGLEQKYPIGTKITGRIREVPYFGAFVEIENGINGLLHNSEISWTNRNASAHDFFKVGDEVEVVVLEVDSSEQQVRLGRKQLQPNPWEQIEEKYPIGTEVKGHVQNITNLGALVEIEEGIDGLIRNSDISWTNRKVDVHDFFKVDNEVKAVILEIDTSKQRVFLSYKQLQPNPWEQIEEKYPIGTEVIGHVQTITTFGAFVEIEEGIVGLIHISELTDQAIEKPEEVVSVGEKLNVKVISISQENLQIRLSLKAMHSDASDIHPDSGTDKHLEQKPMIGNEPITAITYNGQKALPKVIKPDILFSCSKATWETLNDIIKVREDVRKMLLPPIKNPKKILKVLDSLLSSGQEKKVYSLAVTRAGHELYGTIENFNQNEIEMQISGAIVRVYRHGLIEFSTVEYHQGKITEFDNRSGEGFIQSRELPRISVSISEIYGENTIQLVGKSVEFEICQTQQGLEARNVVLNKM